MPEMPPPPPRRPDGQPTIDSEIFEQETPVRHQATLIGGTPAASSNPFMADLPPSEPSNPFLAGVMEPASSPQPPAMASPKSAPRSAPREQQSPSAPRVIAPAVGAPLVARAGAVSPEVRDAHAEFRQGGWKRPLVLILVAGAVLFGMTLLPSADKAAPTPVELSKEPPPAVIGRSLPPGRTSDEDVRAAEREQMKAKPEQNSEPADRPSDIPKEGDFASAFKASTQ